MLYKRELQILLPKQEKEMRKIIYTWEEKQISRLRFSLIDTCFQKLL